MNSIDLETATFMQQGERTDLGGNGEEYDINPVRQDVPDGGYLHREMREPAVCCGHARTVMNAYDDFVADAELRNLAPKTLRYYRQQLRPFLAYCVDHGTEAIDEIGAQHIRGYLHMRRQDQLAEHSIRAAYRAIKAFLNFCVREEMIIKSPMAKIRMPRCEMKILPALSMEQVALLLDACTCARDEAIVLTLVDTGVRASELVGMSWRDLDWKESRIRVHGKGRKDRYVFISPATATAIRSYYEIRGRPGADERVWLSTTKPTPLTQSGLRQMLRRLAKRTSIGHTNPHALRRTYALTCLRNGMDIYRLSRLMGHSDITVLRHYLPLVDADSQEAHAHFGPLSQHSHW